MDMTKRQNKKLCEYCSKEFTIKTFTKANRFCCRMCYDFYLKENSEYMVTKKCKWCRSDFRKKRNEGGDNYCSSKCIIEHQKDKELNIVDCPSCGKKFKRHIYLIKRGKGIFCSHKCWSDKLKLERSRKCQYCGEIFEACHARVKNGTGKYCSRTCCNLWKLKNEPAKVARGNWRGGVRSDLNLYMRSSWEANYARYLNYLKDYNKIKTWEYESEVFRFHKDEIGSKFYLPDFKIFNNDGSISFHEVKGWMDDRSKMQLEKMNKYYPNVKLIVIDTKIYKCINRFFKSLPGWEKA